MIASSAHDVSDARPQRRIVRSVGAVLAGMLVIALLDNGIDYVLHSTGVYPPVGQPMADALFLLALAYRTVDGILGCYVAARLAPHNPRGHALILGGIGVVLSSLGVMATWNGGPSLGRSGIRWRSSPSVCRVRGWVGRSRRDGSQLSSPDPGRNGRSHTGSC